MKLIGMLDSPYVRRVAICLKLLKLDFEHQSISVFSTYEQFKQINPVVKAPTLELDDGQTLMDSTLIIDYLAHLTPNGADLQPEGSAARLRACRLTGLALAAAEKSVQIVYEHKRPDDKQHAPWLARVSEQLLAACGALEADLVAAPLPTPGQPFGNAEVTIAVAWNFIQMMMPTLVVAEQFPALKAFSARAEQRAEFVSTPAE
ncbi:glutathione S-transferase family protein [Rugamonas sp. CCM 8940]|uniref:glutathione S-transferase family protein n=1 Tax=Rugamonas sp. CCM 8940 TaxID=2765359 RepID=UPI0018F31CB4|nr:glutathione S-transferase [Rugamonas sp. CCM 8940]MBJ7314318.1 glutathione S-transferase [Rugamonas sp. CCM 8940]